MDLGIENKVALVTGGSQGIGRAVAEQLAAEGAKVALTYHTRAELAEAAVARITSAGGEALALPLSLDDATTAIAAVHATIARWGRIDILVNNAVMWSERMPGDMPKFEDVPLADWQRLFRGNFESAYAAIQAALPSMRASGFGRIVNVSSGVALDGVSGAGPYGAAKAGLHGLTSVLARELGAAGILVNVVVPGVTLTERMAVAIPPEIQKQRAAGYPIKRLLPPEEVAPTVVFLCSALNTAVTGEIVRVSGGRPYPY